MKSNIALLVLLTMACFNAALLNSALAEPAALCPAEMSALNDDGPEPVDPGDPEEDEEDGEEDEVCELAGVNNSTYLVCDETVHETDEEETQAGLVVFDQERVTAKGAKYDISLNDEGGAKVIARVGNKRGKLEIEELDNAFVIKKGSDKGVYTVLEDVVYQVSAKLQKTKKKRGRSITKVVLSQDEVGALTPEE